MARNNEGMVCDAVVRVLEGITGQERSDTEHPNPSGGPGDVDLLFKLGADQYALEHTRIEAFPNQIQQDIHFSKFISPVLDQLKCDIPKPGIYNLMFPLDARFNVGVEKLEALRSKLTRWVQEMAYEMHEEHPLRLSKEVNPREIRQRATGRPEGFPFDVTLTRSVHWADSGVHDGVLKPSRIAPGDVEDLRRERIQTAIDKKRSKLARRKSDGARAILALENNDISLSNHALVGERLAELLPDRPRWLDELFYIDTTTSSTWTVYRWDWEEAWWEDGYGNFDPRRLNNLY